MQDIVQYIIPVLALALLSGGWMGVQVLARKMKVKNHIDHGGGCCGACDRRGEQCHVPEPAGGMSLPPQEG